MADITVRYDGAGGTSNLAARLDGTTTTVYRATKDGHDVAQGAMADSAATDRTGSWSVIAILKGLLGLVFGLPASGVATVSSSLTTMGRSGAFMPAAGRQFNITTSGSFVGSWRIVRRFADDTTWYPLTAGGIDLYLMTGAASEQLKEDETGVEYAVEVVSYTSGSLDVRISG